MTPSLVDEMARAMALIDLAQDPLENFCEADYPVYFEMARAALVPVLARLGKLADEWGIRANPNLRRAGDELRAFVHEARQ